MTHSPSFPLILFIVLLWAVCDFLSLVSLIVMHRHEQCTINKEFLALIPAIVLGGPITFYAIIENAKLMGGFNFPKYKSKGRKFLEKLES